MGWTINPFTGKPEKTTKKVIVSSSKPSTHSSGDVWYNTIDATLSVYYNGWNVVGVGTPPPTVGTPYGLLLSLTKPT